MTPVGSFPLLLLAFGCIYLKTILAMTGYDRAAFYIPKEDMNCSSTEDVGIATQQSCAFLCAAKNDKVCVGFGHSVSNCELCIACPRSTNLKSLSYGATNFSMVSTFGDFQDELQKGVY